MPTWIIVLANFVTIIIIVGGALNFPYVPMFFGVPPGASYRSFREFLIVKLIWLFPLISLICIYTAWAVDGAFALVPFVYIVFVWLIRTNENQTNESGMQYQSRQDNLNAKSKELDFLWGSWSKKHVDCYILFTFYAPSKETSIGFFESINNTEEVLFSEPEQAEYDNGSSSIYLRIVVSTVDKSTIKTLTDRMVNIAWDSECELVSLNILEVAA